MNVLIENWAVVFAIACVLCMALATIITFAKKPNSEKIADVKEWLKWAVSKAEKILGSKTGQLKLRLVYDMFCERFPEVSKVVSFETFSGWVDEALEWMKDQLEKNDAIKCYISTLGE